MGRLNELLGAAAYYSRGIAAQFNQDEQEGVPTLAPELVPTSDIHMRPEQWALHGGTLLIGRSAVAAGGVGFHSQSAIEPGVGELVIVEKVAFCFSGNPASQDLKMYSSQNALPDSTGNLVSRDARRIITSGSSGASGTRIREGNGAALTGTASIIWEPNTASGTVPAQGYTEVELDYVLVSPWSIRLVNITANQALMCTWWVRARPATPRELAVFPRQSAGGAL